MALPAEVAELIIDRCQHRPTLSSCSLVCKAWHTRARFRLFSAAPVNVVDVPGVPRVKEFVATLRHPLCTLHPYIHSLSIRQSSLSASFLNPVIPVLVGLPNLTSLQIVAEHALLSDECLDLFRTQFRSIRHLLLRMTFATCADAVGLVCSFPLLENLRLYARWIGSTPPPPASLPPNLHTLDLGGFLDDVLAWLLSCPPSPALSSVQVRDIAEHEFGIVFEYVKFLAATLKRFQLSFADKESERRSNLAFFLASFSLVGRRKFRRIQLWCYRCTRVASTRRRGPSQRRHYRDGAPSFPLSHLPFRRNLFHLPDLCQS